jgi:lipopolysaccharide export LptBFGC system permease protein LptF
VARRAQGADDLLPGAAAALDPVGDGAVPGLARSSELVVIRAAGRSALRMLVEPFIATLLFGVLVVAALNPVIAAGTRLYQAQVQAITAPDLVLQVAVDETGLWLRQGDSLGQTVIRAGAVEEDGLTFRDTGFIAFDRDTGAPSRGSRRRGRAWAPERGICRTPSAGT